MIDIHKAIYFYDDRNKIRDVLKLERILFRDNEVCLCEAKWDIPPDHEAYDLCADAVDNVEYILFNRRTREVLTCDFQSWYATNDMTVT